MSETSPPRQPSRRRNSELRDGEKKCVECQTFRPFSAFSPAKRGLGGLTSYCRECWHKRYRNPNSTEYRRPRALALVEGEQKLCLHCQQFLPLIAFGRSSKGIGGLNSYCRMCTRARYGTMKRERMRQIRAQRRTEATPAPDAAVPAVSPAVSPPDHPTPRPRSEKRKPTKLARIRERGAKLAKRQARAEAKARTTAEAPT